MLNFLRNGVGLTSLVIIALGMFSGVSYAGENTLLTVENEISGYSQELSEVELLEFEQIIVETENEFVDGLAEFTGPRARDVLALLGEDGFDTVILVAANDYSVEVPLSDFDDYEVIFAMTQNGEKLSTRDKGPIWVIYPMSDHKELQDRVYNDRLIWQLVKVVVK